MMPTIQILCQEGMTVPSAPANQAALIEEALKQTRTTVEEHRDILELDCFNWPDLDASPTAAAYAVLRAVMDFLYDHPGPSSILLRCGSESCRACYQFQWNMWFAASKPDGH